MTALFIVIISLKVLTTVGNFLCHIVINGIFFFFLVSI